MKKIIILLVLALSLTTHAGAFLYELPILTVNEIARLNDEDLMERYIEAKIESKASEEFHRAAGFNSGKEYGKRKKLLRYVFDLRREMSKREKVEAGVLDALLK